MKYPHLFILVFLKIFIHYPYKKSSKLKFNLTYWTLFRLSYYNYESPKIFILAIISFLTTIEAF